MTNDEKRKIYAALSAPFSEEAIQRTDGRTTGRGYDTVGVGYQFVANRLNEVLGVGGWRTQQTMNLREITTSKGRPAFDATCDVTIQFGEWVDGRFLPWAEAFATSGHQSVSEADARKGAFTNGLKKAAAMLGCGKQAYEGTLDDDNVSSDEPEHIQAQPRARVEPQQPPAPAPRPQPPQQEPEAMAAPQASASDLSRNRLTSKQLAAIWALARKLNYQQSQFRQQIKASYGVQPEFLDKNAASQLIGQLTTRASNGHSHPTGAYGVEA